MDNFSMHVNGVDNVVKYLNAQVVKLDMAAKNFVQKGGLIIANHAKDEFQGGGTPDENYPRPTLRTGNLRNSIKVLDVRQESLGVWSSKTGPTLIYGRRVELGFNPFGPAGAYGRGHAKTRAFPYLAPGFEKSRGELKELYNYEFRKALS